MRANASPTTNGFDGRRCKALTATCAIARRCHAWPSVVMAGLVPAIHAVKRPLCKLDDCLARSVFLPSCAGLAAWMAGTSLAMTVNNI